MKKSKLTDEQILLAEAVDQREPAIPASKPSAHAGLSHRAMAFGENQGITFAQQVIQFLSHQRSFRDA